jgi:DNA-binding NarL/FixJ family response regulator
MSLGMYSFVVMAAGLTGDGTRLAVELAHIRQHAGVIVLVTDLFPGQLVALLRTGACGVLYKDDSPADLVRAVRVVAADGAYLSSRVAGQLADGLHRDGWIPQPRGSADVGGLTDRELQIFRLVAEGQTNNEIARKLFISEATVKSHFNRICKKLGIENRVQAVIMAHELDMIVY